jgi:hypothetical protein
MIGNPLLLPDEGYNISRSVRLRSSASAYFNRTPGSAGNRRTWTWSGWVKRGALGTGQGLFSAFLDSNNFTLFRLESDNTLMLYHIRSSTDYSENTTAVFRDPSAWYHVVLSVDTTQATAANRIRIYINGTQQVTTQLYGQIIQNEDTFANTTNAHNLGRNADGATNYFDGYLTEINFIDGQALTPSSFGETDAITGVWKPKKYTGTYGTNGFYLNFSDPSAATAAAIGKDYSGNGNNWTPNNISVTAGTTYDSMLDVPTLWADGGNGRGNYAVFNAIKPYGGAVSITNGNLTATNSSNYTIDTTFGVSSGQYYCELTATTVATRVEFGIALNYNWAVNYRSDGQKNVNGTLSSYGATWTSGDVIGMAFDIGASTVTFYKNGVSQGQITGITYYSADNCVTVYGIAGSVHNINFGQRPFSYTPPTGFKALNTTNLPDSTIVQGNQWMDATTFTANGGVQTITNSGSMQPDMVWLKDRSVVSNHTINDSVRGSSVYVYPNLTNAEATNANYLTSFNSNGFSLGSANYTNGEAIVGWQWKEGATSGFDIVTWAGNSTSGRTIAHSLGVAPNVILTKSRSNPSSWIFGIGGIAGFGVNDYLVVNSTNAKATSSTFYQAYGSSTFTVGVSAADEMNKTGNNYVSYLFAQVAGFSAFGSYTGNGSSDGPFVYTGFRPRWIMWKRSDASDNWNIMDTARNTFNLTNSPLYPNLSNAEGSGNSIDILSNGFKVRDSGAPLNASGGTYIYAAFAENPFRNSLAR